MSSIYVLLGFEIGSGRPVFIPMGHMAITGQSQQSGKTTTLEGLASRMFKSWRAIAFITKRGEGSFRVSTPIAPYFRDRTDWPFIASIMEATVSEKLKFQRTEIIKLCQDYDGPEGKWTRPATLADVQANAERALIKARGIAARVYTELAEYLRMVVPQIETLPRSKKLELAKGLNVMDLAEYDFPLQALIVRSAIEWIHHNSTQTITVIPEAWKFAPKIRNTPVRLAAEELIRQGAALKNFLWCDVQDLAGLSSVLLRQVTVFLFGVQRDPREIERTLEHLPADARRPSRGDVMDLQVGQFFASFEKQLVKVYVCPAWMTELHAQAIATGEESIESAREIVQDFDSEHESSSQEE